MAKVSDKRAMKVAVVSNCLLNQNAKVHEFAFLPAMVDPLVDVLRKCDYGLLQLPCPELSYIGADRWWAVREQYDNPAYRRHCARLLEPVVDQIQEYVRHGYKVVVVGLDGSPSCGVNLSGSSEQWGGRPHMPEADYPVISARGVFIEELARALTARGIELPMIGAGFDVPNFDLATEVRRIEEFLTR